MYIVFDIGGTKTRVALSRDGETLEEPIIRATPADWQEAEGMIAEVFGLLGKQAEIKKVVGGLPGVFDKERGVLLRSPNLLGWLEKPFLATIEKATGAPVTIYNDTIVVGMGETMYGAGKGFEIVAYITVSTGVGGARIVNGQVDEFRYGFEPGQQIIDADKLISLEDLVSGTAFEKKYGANFVKEAPASAWEEAARRLAVGVHNTIVHWSPDIVVLGGSMITKTPGIPPALVLEHLKHILSIFPKAPEVRPAILSEKGGLWGSLVLAKRA